MPADLVHQIESAATPEQLHDAWEAVLEACYHLGRPQTREEADRARTAAARRLHPDAGGTDAAFRELTEHYTLWTEAFAVYRSMRAIMGRHPAAFQPLPPGRPTFTQALATSMAKPRRRRKVAKAAGNLAQGVVESVIDAMLRR
jgi:hypothetical protein